MAYASGESAGLVSDAVTIQHRTPLLSGLLSATEEEVSSEDRTCTRTVTVIGAAGGVGTTTVAATLARIASRRGRNVFLLDGADESIVPLYLGAGRVVSGVSAGWSYFPHPGSRQGVISVITCGEPVGGQNDQSPWNRARNLGGAADDVIVDSGCHRYLDCSAETIHSTATLVVLAPDIRSVLQVRHIERKFAGRDEGSLPRYVLNQFVSELPQHQEVRASLSDHLGGRLAPTTVRSAPEISQALAQGLTVIDFAPDSPVARDLVQVAEWLRNNARSAIHTRQSATAAGL